MQTFLLDTTVLLHFWRGVPTIRQWVNEATSRGDILGTSSVNVAEVYSGAQRVDRSKWESFFLGFPVWPVDGDAGMRAGELRFDLARRGVHVQLPDALIAAVAHFRGATVVTANVKDFRAMTADYIELDQ